MIPYDDSRYFSEAASVETETYCMRIERKEKRTIEEDAKNSYLYRTPNIKWPKCYAGLAREELEKLCKSWNEIEKSNFQSSKFLTNLWFLSPWTI